MNTSSKPIADQLSKAHMERVFKARAALQTNIQHTTLRQFFFQNYYEAYGTTTECYNILGHAGLLPPKEHKPCKLLSRASSPTH